MINKPIHPIIKEAIDNNLYGLDAETFFIEKILLPIEQSRNQKPKVKLSHLSINDREFFNDYLTYLKTPLIPTLQLLEKLEVITSYSDLQSDFLAQIDKIFTTKFLIWMIANSNEKQAKILSVGMTRKLNLSQYNMNEVIENLHIIKDETRKEIFISEIYLTKNSAYYKILDKHIQLKSDKKGFIVENILIQNNESMILNRDIVKEIIKKKVEKNSWILLDKYITNMGIQKIDFLLDIIIDLRKEAKEENILNNYNKLIYKIYDKGLHSKKTEVIDRLLEIKKEKPDIANTDLYVLIIKRSYLNLKKEKAQEYFLKVLEIAKENNDINELKNVLFTNMDSYKIRALNLNINMKEEYFQKELKTHFKNYLEEKFQPKQITIKPKKI